MDGLHPTADEPGALLSKPFQLLQKLEDVRPHREVGPEPATFFSDPARLDQPAQVIVGSCVDGRRLGLALLVVPALVAGSAAATQAIKEPLDSPTLSAAGSQFSRRVAWSHSTASSAMIT